MVMIKLDSVKLSEICERAKLELVKDEEKAMPMMDPHDCNKYFETIKQRIKTIQTLCTCSDHIYLNEEDIFALGSAFTERT